jgi:hypothetical protein
MELLQGRADDACLSASEDSELESLASMTPLSGLGGNDFFSGAGEYGCMLDPFGCEAGSASDRPIEGGGVEFTTDQGRRGD